MAKFCNYCGAQLEDDAVFCASCGGSQEEAPASASAPAFKMPEVSLTKKFLPIIIGAVAAIVVVILAIVLISNSGGYKKALKSYGKADVGNFEDLEKLAPQEYWEYLEDKDNKDVDDYIKNYEDNYERYIDELEDDYGDNLKVNYKIESKDSLKKNRVERIAKALDKEYEIDKDSVKKIVKVKGKAIIKGSDDDDDVKFTYYMAKIGKNWYRIEFDSDEDGYDVKFLLVDLEILANAMDS